MNGNVFIIKMNGAFGVVELLKLMNVVIDKSTSFKELLILEECNGTVFKYMSGVIGLIITFLQVKLNKACRIRHAMVRSCPKGTALGLIYAQKNTIKNYCVNVFSTNEKALKWLAMG